MDLTKSKHFELKPDIPPSLSRKSIMHSRSVEQVKSARTAINYTQASTRNYEHPSHANMSEDTQGSRRQLTSRRAEQTTKIPGACIRFELPVTGLSEALELTVNCEVIRK